MIDFKNYIEIDKIRYKINPDFRNIIEIEQIFKNTDLSEIDKVYQSLNKFYLFFDKIDEEMHEKLAKEMVNFYIYKKDNGKGVKTNVEIYDYEHDWDMIYGAFYECYKIRLNKYMHWHEFKQLFDSLNSECKLSKVMSYRGYKGTDKEMNKLKKYWALPIKKQDKDRYDNIYEQLIKRGE